MVAAISAIVPLPALCAPDRPTFWLCPSMSTRGPLASPGARNTFEALLSSTAQWPVAAARVGVFQAYASYLANARDDELRSVFAFLKAHRMKLAVEFGVMTRPTFCGAGVEGYAQGGAANLARIAMRIQRLGGTLDYVAMDEPVYHGALSHPAGACLWSASEMVGNAAVAVAVVRRVFPSVQFGDTEPLRVDATVSAADLLASYKAFMDAWASRWHAPLAFFHLDVYWQPNSYGTIYAIQEMAQASGVPFGLIVNGNVHAASGLEWNEQAINRLTTYLAFARGLPDQLVFQSWSHFPDEATPEWAPGTHTHLIVEATKLLSARTGASSH